VELARSEMTRLVEEHGQLGHAEELDGNAIGINAKVVMKRQEHKILGLEGAVRFLKEENFRLRLPPPDAPVAIATSMDWLHAPLQAPTHPRQKQFQTLQRKGADVLEQMLELASRPHVVDLTALPENKLAWRPAKESSRWRVERRNEEWLDWKQGREDLVRQARSSRPRQNGASLKAHGAVAV
jgi:dynactin 1